MAERTLVANPSVDPSYVAWRGELLAQLALSRLDGVDVFRPHVDGDVDYVLAAPDGVYVSVIVKAYSSAHLGLGDVAALPALRWQLDRAVVDRARASHSPVVLLLFDADSEHGRYLRLDTLPAPAPSVRRVPVALPAANVIDVRSLQHVVSELRRDDPRGRNDEKSAPARLRR